MEGCPNHKKVLPGSCGGIEANPGASHGRFCCDHDRLHFHTQAGKVLVAENSSLRKRLGDADPTPVMLEDICDYKKII
jgi:hypothetical protein